MNHITEDRYAGLLIRHLSTALVDALCVPVRFAQGAIPVQDIGLVAAVQAGAVHVVRSIERFDGGEVVLADGARPRRASTSPASPTRSAACSGRWRPMPGGSPAT